jgi:hypothetical protein
MARLPFSTLERAELYCTARHQVIEKKIGGGADGEVFMTRQRTVVKALNQEALYQNEVAVYERIHEENLLRLSGFLIPRMLDHDAELWVFEMTLVSPPCVVDFASASLTGRREFPEDILSQWLAERKEEFGTNWPIVRKLMFAFEQHGIYLSDVHPRNVMFPD